MASTSTSSWLDAKHQDIVPKKAEIDAVRAALDIVERRLETAGDAFSIAKRHPCGSFAKSTMLAGRKEADLVVVLANAPSEATLDELCALLAACPEVRAAKVRHKAVELQFWDGVGIDVLPVAERGVTAPGSNVPPKLTHALSGPKHVEWFTKHAHGKAIHPVVRLLKKLKAEQAAMERLGSFAIEVLAVDILEGFEGNLAEHFQKVLTRLADGYLDGRTLPDPADASNDLLKGVSPEERRSIAEAARRALGHLESGNGSNAFAAASAVLPSSNIGGKTLA